jgi:hypothetical protein
MLPMLQDGNLVISTSPKQSKHQLGQQLLKPWC